MASLFDFFGGGPASPYASLLTEDSRSALQNEAALIAGLQMMQAATGAPGKPGPRLAQAVVPGLAAGREAFGSLARNMIQRDAVEDLPYDLQRLARAYPDEVIPEYVESRFDPLKMRGIGDVQPGNWTPESMQKFTDHHKATGEFRHALLVPKLAQHGYETVETDDGRLLLINRADATTRVAIGPDGKPILPASTSLSFMGEKEQVQKLGQLIADVRLQLPMMENSVRNLEANVDKLLSHPGMEAGLGALDQIIPAVDGSDRAEFIRLHQQMESIIYMEARKALAGGGQITENEADKAARSMHAMSRAQTPENYKKAVNDFLDATRSAVTSMRAATNLPYLRSIERLGLAPGGEQDSSEQTEVSWGDLPE